MRAVWSGGDGFSWRRGNYVWRRLDFLTAVPDGGASYLLDRAPLWKELCCLGYPAPDAFHLHFSRYYARNRWVPGRVCSSLNPREIVFACLALVPAFSAGLLHGDLSPENLVLTPEGRCEWIDWLHTGFPGNFCPRGKPAYLAPDRAALGLCTLASEIYALGRLLAHWSYGSAHEKSLAPLIESATHPLPSHRPASLPEFLDELNGCLEV